MALAAGLQAAGIQLDHDYIRDKTLEGQQTAAARGRRGGRPKVIDDVLTIKTGKNTGQNPSVASVYRALADADAGGTWNRCTPNDHSE